MNKFFKPHEQQLDDQLSEFTDRILSGETEMNMDEALNQAELAELAELQKTVVRMKAAAQAAHPSEATNTRIRSNLLLEWKQGRQAETIRPRRLSWPWSLPRMVLAGGLVVLSVFGIIALFFTPIVAPLIGAAEGSPVWALLFIAVGIIIIALLLWLDHHD
jgi:sterol desaturase/sphingolipid hydroxylase (fatty acid hydroxylase superfamily)